VNERASGPVVSKIMGGTPMPLPAADLTSSYIPHVRREGQWVATRAVSLIFFPAMTAEHLREILHSRAPLIVHETSGRRFVIPHSDYAHISQSQNYLVFTDEKDRVGLIRLPSIESITVAEEPAA
jgi:hypothetical protein